MFTHLTDDQWQRIEPLLPSLPMRADGKGRRWRDSRQVLDGILWVLHTGAPWAALPKAEYPPYQTCHRRFRRWVKDDTLKRIAHAFAAGAALDLSECFIDGTFASAKKGGYAVGKTKRGKGTKLMLIADRNGLPVAAYVDEASPHEVTLVQKTLAARFVTALPQRLVGDRAYDSDPLDAELAAQGVEMISPHRSNRVAPQTQDGRPLRRYKRRWKVERLNAWLQNFRRVTVRWDLYSTSYLGMVHLACMMILLRRL